MPKFRIKDWLGGLITDNDDIDMPQNSSQKLMNWIVRPGKITRRKACVNFITAGLTAVKSFAEFKLFGASGEERFMVVKDGAGFEKHDYSGGSYSIGSITDGYGGTVAAGDFAYFKSINNNVRAGIWSGWKDTAATAWWLGYIDRDYFKDAYQPPGGWFAEDAKLTPPTNGIYALTKPGTRARTYTLAEDDDYRVRVTYEYDGYQESWYKDNTTTSQDNVEITGNDEDYISIDFTLPTTLNKRITALNVYVARAEDKDIKPYTAYYHVGRIPINNANWVFDDPDYDISLRIRREDAGTFPVGYVSSLDNFTTILLNDFVEELYLKNNAITSVLGFDLHGYTNSAWINQRNFVIRPALSYNIDDLPYDERQTVLFSQSDKPDCFHVNVDYMDFSTREGDPCTGLAELWGNLIVFKERNMFKVRFNNSGNSLSWEIDEHFQKVGMIAPNSLAVGDGKLFFLGQDNVYMFDGSKAVSITKDRIKDELIAYVDTSEGDFSNYEHIYGEYDPINKLYYLMIVPDANYAHCYVYDVDADSWRYQYYSDTDYLPESLSLGVDYDLLSNTATTKIFKVDSALTAGEEDIDVEYESQFFTLDDNPFRQKRIKQLKVLSENNHTFSMSIYKDGSSSASYTDTIGVQSIRDVTFNETSLSGRAFKVEIVTTGRDLLPTNTLEISEIEIDYDLLDER